MNRKPKQAKKTWEGDPFKTGRSPFPRKPTQVHQKPRKSERKHTRDQLRKEW